MTMVKFCANVSFRFWRQTQSKPSLREYFGKSMISYWRVLQRNLKTTDGET